MTRRLVTAVGLMAALVAASVAVTAADSASPAVTIHVTIRDTGFSLSKKTAPVGAVVFAVKNAGKLSHSFAIDSRKTPVLKPGRSATLRVSFKKRGAFPYRSTVTGQTKLKGTVTITAPPKPAFPGDPVAGKTVFTSTGGCNSCHTLKAAAAVGTIGPNLDQLQLAYAVILGDVTNGKNGALGSMPAFKATLSATQIQDVSAFVFKAEHPGS
jgi:mono/diheme cytochrome c family protein